MQRSSPDVPDAIDITMFSISGRVRNIILRPGMDKTERMIYDHKQI